MIRVNIRAMHCLIYAKVRCGAREEYIHPMQKLMLLRKEAAAREAELREEAAAARGEAEAAAQLVHALQPKGDFVLGTLWTKVIPFFPMVDHQIFW